jgi:DNA-binding MarR family transcriptional regulator
LEETGGAHGLSLPQFEVLLVLNQEQGLTQQELAGRLLVSKGNVCAMIARMEANGLVERRSDPDDRRANRVFPTKHGAGLLAKTVPEHQAVVDRVMGVLSDAELQTLYQLLDRLEEGLEGGPLR